MSQPLLSSQLCLQNTKYEILSIISLFSDTSMKLYITQAASVIHMFRVQIWSGAAVLVAELIFLLSIIKSSCCCSVSISGKLTEHSEVPTISFITGVHVLVLLPSSAVLSTCIRVDGPLVLHVTRNTILYDTILTCLHFFSSAHFMDKMNSVFIAYRHLLPETAGWIAFVSSFSRCLVSLPDDDTCLLLRWQHHFNHLRFLKWLLSLCVHLLQFWKQSASSLFCTVKITTSPNCCHF